MAPLMRAIAGWYRRAGFADRLLAGVFLAIFAVGLVLVADGLWMEVSTADNGVIPIYDTYAESARRISSD